MSIYVNGVLRSLSDYYASMVIFNNAVATPIASANVWTNLSNLSQSICQNSSYYNSALIPKLSGDYLISYDATIMNAKDKSFEMSLAVNNSVQNPTVNQILSHVTDKPYHISGSAFVNLNSNDSVGMMIRNVDSADDGTIKYASVYIRGL